MRKVAIALTAGLLLCVTALSSAAPIVGLTANVLPEGKWMMDTWMVYQSYTKTWEDGPYNGGGWDGAAGRCMSSDRRRGEPGYRHYNLGVRLLRSAD